MCGIAGLVYFDQKKRADSTILQRMCDAMVHRGPDDEGFFIDQSVGLGHRRLSIIDLEGGHQPMFNEDGSLVIVFNGEIYNYRELRDHLLERGHTFKTRSDTEVILHAYEEFGDLCVEKLRGMFAFALWDRNRKRLFLSRDRVGIKPLYYLLTDKNLLFASEIKAILQCEDVERRMDLSALDAFLSLRYVPGPKTMFQGIYKLNPGHTLICENGKIQIKKYWDLYFENNRIATEKELGRVLEEMLDEVCRIHLMSEVPYGVFLSGGLDSGSLVAQISGCAGGRLKTFSVGYEGYAENEFDAAQTISKKFGTEHYPLLLSAQDFSDLLPKLVWHLDEPVADPTCIPLYFLSRFAKPHATVIHSGEGADEIFAGYSIYKKNEWMGGLQSIPGFTTMARLSKTILPLSRYPKFSHYLNLSGLPLSRRYLGVSSIFSNGLKQQLLKESCCEGAEYSGYLDDTFGHYYKTVKDQASLNRMLFIDLKTWLPDDLLVKADKMTMAASIEQRVPYLDHKLIEFAAGLPPDLKLKRNETKYLFKKVMEPHLPREIIYQTKKGFPVPIADWFRNGLSGFIREALLEPQSRISEYLHLDVINQILKTHQDGKQDMSNEIFGLLTLEFWMRMFVHPSHVYPR